MLRDTDLASYFVQVSNTYVIQEIFVPIRHYVEQHGGVEYLVVEREIVGWDPANFVVLLRGPISMANSLSNTK